MSGRKHDTPEDTDVMAIPAFLRRDCDSRSPQPLRNRYPRRKRRPLPPESMMPVLRAIKRSRDTIQKLRASLGDKYSDDEIRKGLAALIRIGSIHRVGRRYIPVASVTPPPKQSRR